MVRISHFAVVNFIVFRNEQNFGYIMVLLPEKTLPSSYFSAKREIMSSLKERCQPMAISKVPFTGTLNRKKRIRRRTGKEAHSS